MILASAIFGGPAYGWYFALKHMNPAPLDGCSLVAIILLVLAGTVLFGESLRFAVAHSVFGRHL